MNSSLVYLPSKQRSNCGYCKASLSRSYVMLCDRMLPEDYQLLLNRGWRRCGTFYYKSVMSETCCPLYTIRCGALDFESSKSQRKTMIRFHNFLKTGHAPSMKNIPNRCTNDNNSSNEAYRDIFDITYKFRDPLNIESTVSNLSIPNIGVINSKAIKIADCVLKDKLFEIPTRLKAKHKRWLSKVNKMKAKHQLNSEEDYMILIRKRSPYLNNVKVLESFFTNMDNSKMNLRIKLFTSISLLKDYPEIVHEEHKIYKKYQIHVHKENETDCELSRFKRFLLHSSLSLRVMGNEVNGLCYGSYHCIYFINDTIAAVSVWDILPYGLSSVYFFYDPKYDKLSFGTYSALRDIAFVRYINQFFPHFKYYFLGLYIHSCSKMRYKAKFYPSFLLCPEIYTWVPYFKCVPILDAYGYHRLESDNDKVDEQSADDVKSIKILCSSGLRTLNLRHLQPFGNLSCLSNVLKTYLVHFCEYLHAILKDLVREFDCVMIQGYSSTIAILDFCSELTEIGVNRMYVHIEV